MNCSDTIPVLLGLGSNISYAGKAPVNLLACACVRLMRILKTPVFSSIYKTKARYVTDQADFYNMAVRGFVGNNVTPHALLEEINKIEAEYGRDRSHEIRFGPRPLDIDIELFGNEIVNDADLVIPHPRMHERAFVLIPALEILTDSADLLYREKYAAELARLPDQGVELFMPFSGLNIPAKAE